MKILHVMAGAPTGGAENIFLEDVLALADGGVRQHVLTRPNNDFRLSEFGRKGVGVTTAGFHHLIRWPTGKRLKKVAGAFDPDIIQYWMGRAGSYAILSDAVNVGWYGGYYKLRRFQNCDYHIGITPDIVRHIVAQGVAPEQTQLIHTYAEFPKVQAARRAEFHTPENAPLLLALARLHQKKGLDVCSRRLRTYPLPICGSRAKGRYVMNWKNWRRPRALPAAPVFSVGAMTAPPSWRRVIFACFHRAMSRSAP